MDLMHIQKKDSFKILLVRFVVLIAALFPGCPAEAGPHGKQTADDIKIEKPLRRLVVGEELTFNVAWLGVNVGTCVAKVRGLETVGGREAYVVELTAKTNDILSKIYPVNDRYISYIDTEKFATLKHVVSRREGRYKKDAVTVFDYLANKAYFANSLDGSKKTFDIPGYCQDSLSAAYYFRMLDVHAGDRIEYKVVNNEQVYDIIGVIRNKGFVKIRGRTYEAFYVEPQAKLKGEKVRKGRAGCWFSCSPARLPVYGIVKAPLFTKVTAALVNVKPLDEGSGFYPESYRRMKGGGK